MNFMHKFSVKPKTQGENYSCTKAYPVLYIYHETNFDVFCIKGDDGTPEFLRNFEVTVEDVEL